MSYKKFNRTELLTLLESTETSIQLAKDLLSTAEQVNAKLIAVKAKLELRSLRKRKSKILKQLTK